MGIAETLTLEEAELARAGIEMFGAGSDVGFEVGQAIVKAARFGLMVLENRAKRSPRFTNLGIGVVSDA